MARRSYVWKSLPSPPMTLFPAPADGKANAWNTAKEVLVFKSLFRGDRLLWLGAWLFHAVLALILVGHIRVFFNADALLEGLGMSPEQIQAMSGSVGGAAGVVILATAVFLLVRRLLIRRVREITAWSDCLALVLIGAIIITGNLLRFGPEHFDLGLTRRYFAGLAALRDVRGEAVLANELFMLHMSLAFVLLMIIPFSKILHFGGIFFTHPAIRKH